MKKLLPLLFLLWANAAWGQDVGYLFRTNCNLITSPVTNSTVCWQTQTNVRPVGEYYWNGTAWTSSSTGGVGGGHTILDEGAALTQRGGLNFVGSGVVATDDAGNDRTIVTITAGAESDPVVGAVSGIVKGDGKGGISAAVAGVDYQAVGSYQTLDSDLTALANNGTNGIWVRTGAGTGAARTITGIAGEVSVTDGDGVSGNPTIGAGADVIKRNQANAYSGGGLQDMSANELRIYNSAGYAPTAEGRIGVNTTTHKAVIGLNGVSQSIATEASNVATATALAADPTDCTYSSGSFAIGITAAGTATCQNPVISGAAAPAAGTVAYPGQPYKDTRALGGGNGLTYIGDAAGGNFRAIATESDNYTTVQGNAGAATPSGSDTLDIKGDGTILTSTCANGSPDACTFSVVAASIPPSKLTTAANTSEFTFNLFGTGAANVIEDTQDIARIYSNEGTTKTITQIKAWTDTGTSRINLQRNDGSPANICTDAGDLVATTAGVTCALSATEKVINNGYSIGLDVITGAASGTPTQVHINIKWTKAD